MANLPKEYFQSEEFLKADAEHRQKVREERYAAQYKQQPAAPSQPRQPLQQSAIELAIIDELNRARTNPKGYATLLERERKPRFDGDNLKYHTP